MRWRKLERHWPRHAVAGLDRLEPIPQARRIFCVGANYPKVHPTGGVVSGPDA